MSDSEDSILCQSDDSDVDRPIVFLSCEQQLYSSFGLVHFVSSMTSYSQHVDPIKGGHLAAPAVHLLCGPNQVIADSAGSVFTLQLMELIRQRRSSPSHP